MYNKSLTKEPLYFKLNDDPSEAQELIDELIEMYKLENIYEKKVI